MQVCVSLGCECVCLCVFGRWVGVSVVVGCERVWKG